MKYRLQDRRSGRQEEQGKKKVEKKKERFKCVITVLAATNDKEITEKVFVNIRVPHDNHKHC